MKMRLLVLLGVGLFPAAALAAPPADTDAYVARAMQTFGVPGLSLAIVENGTRPDERVSSGRLSDLARLAAPHSRGDAGPSLIIVGEVAALAAADFPEEGQPSLAKVS